MNAFSLCLLLLGVINYINSILTNIAARKSEFAIMRCIGMTRKQLRRMLMMESLYYWSILQVSLLTVGSGMAVGAGFIIRNNLPYFTFVFPLKEWLMISAIMIILCVCIPQIMYMKNFLRNRRKRTKRTKISGIV